MTKELEYIQRHIDIVKQQIKGSKMKIIVTDTVTKHQYDYYERELQTLESIEKSIHRLESIDNAEPSEALVCLEKVKYYEVENHIKEGWNIILYEEMQEELDTIEQALLKAQEPKKYLKWEDLEKDRTYKVLLNGSQYELVKRYDDYEYHCDYITLQKKPNVSIFIYEWNKEIFNDLHLERVEE